MGKVAISAGVARAVGLLSTLAIAVGVGGASSGLLAGFVGFRIFGLGLLLGVAAVLFGIVGLVRTRSATGLRGSGRAWTGLLLGAGAVAILVLSAAPGAGLPPINDITTNTEDPPAFVAAPRHPENAGRAWELDPGFVPQIREAYPDLKPMRLPEDPPEALGRVERAARELGWEIVEVAPEEGRLEAYEVTRVFRFVDDVVVRVRPADGGSVVDVRSRSRDGRGDLGANAARIRAFRAELSDLPEG
jgi:uncharacterized protein (DUF1499 family)